MASTEQAANPAVPAADPLLNLSDPAELVLALRDIHLPAPVSAWPFSPMAWAVVSILTLLLGLCIRYFWQRHHKSNPMFMALSQLDSSYAQWKNSGSASLYLEQSGVTLKRLAVHFAGRSAIARLSGQQWVEWMITHSNQPLPESVQSALHCERYKKMPNTDINQLHKALSAWVRNSQRNFRA
ncbi:MAG: hypothetical protein ACI9UN_000234 [Granulosicoccus sp.]|jgi:hypothetical protein